MNMKHHYIHASSHSVTSYLFVLCELLMTLSVEPVLHLPCSGSIILPKFVDEMPCEIKASQKTNCMTSTASLSVLTVTTS